MKTLDTRDLQERQAELQEEKETLESALEEAKEELSDAVGKEDTEAEENAVEAAQTALNEWLEENQEDLAELDTLESEVGHEWVYGETLIREQDFVEYCQELLSDIGDLPRDIPSYIVIDWDATADNLKIDYSEADYQGTTYLFRMS